MSERKEGWYWIKECGYPWKAAYWAEESWILPGDDVSRDEDELDGALIGPRIPTPDEPWQCVPVEPTNVMEDVLFAWADSPRQSWLEVLAASPKPEDV